MYQLSLLLSNICMCVCVCVYVCMYIYMSIYYCCYRCLKTKPCRRGHSCPSFAVFLSGRYQINPLYSIKKRIYAVVLLPFIFPSTMMMTNRLLLSRRPVSLILFTLSHCSPRINCVQQLLLKFRSSRSSLRSYLPHLQHIPFTPSYRAHFTTV